MRLNALHATALAAGLCLLIVLAGPGSPRASSADDSGVPLLEDRNESGDGVIMGSESEIDELMALQYLGWSPVENGTEDKHGVELNLEGAYPGYNLYNDDDGNFAMLLDMDGGIVNVWYANLTPYPRRGWHHVEYADDGLFVIVKDRALMKLDWDSGVIWNVSMQPHHDITFGGDGLIYALDRTVDRVNYSSHEVPVLADYVTVLSSDGEKLWNISLYALLGGFVSNESMDKLLEHHLDENVTHNANSGPYYDVVHTNSIEYLDRDIPGFCHRGDLLVSTRMLSIIAVVDPVRERIVWLWGPGVLDYPHHPTLLDNGNVLVFDNGFHRRYSQVLEIDPLTLEVVWNYTGTPPNRFHSMKRGSAYRLPNGNTLICSSDQGWAFEVGYDGSVVWEFYNPHLKDDNESRAIMYRMARLEPEMLGLS
ncbi:MAG: hypothetical protein GF416_05470 [Candidatus Altiarchaeales archaeon]|nr:hypothetical protein [Candidatus Altiarchaeales archaeon]MBD3416567.1 hypothetical protein [Candidatus Altiarchaeales archaeon]